MQESQEEKKRFGAFFREKRSALGLSLKEISHTLSIRETTLQAIEDGELEKLLSPVHAQGFIRQYAHFLQIDLAVLQREFASLLRSSHHPQEFEFGIGTMEMRSPKGAGVRFPSLWWVLGSTGAIALLWLLAKWLDLV